MENDVLCMLAHSRNKAFSTKRSQGIKSWVHRDPLSLHYENELPEWVVWIVLVGQLKLVNGILPLEKSKHCFWKLLVLAICVHCTMYMASREVSYIRKTFRIKLQMVAKLLHYYFIRNVTAFISIFLFLKRNIFVKWTFIRTYLRLWVI